MKLLTKILPAALLAAMLIGCNDDDDDHSGATDPGNIVEVAATNGSFTTLIAALEATGLDAVLADETRQFTIFAPTDAAFTALGDISGLSTDELSDILLYHVVADADIDTASAISSAGTTITMANSDDAGLALAGSDLFINASQVETADVNANNGVIHVINAVLLPTTDNPASGTITDVAIANGNFTTLVNALTTTGLDATLADASGKFTVFAPTDAAFAKIDLSGLSNDQLRDVLLYHVISGSEVNAAAATALGGNTVAMGNGDDMALSLSGSELFANLSAITTPNVDASNGIIHIVDTVILPPADATTPTQNIVEIAGADGNFSKLVAALQTTGLDATLADASAEFTVFAPTDAAFAALQADLGLSDAALLALPNLADILSKHVVTGAVDSITAFTLNGTDVVTVSGETVAISIDSGELSIDDSRVTTFDIAATNGIIHVIDSVILPD